MRYFLFWALVCMSYAGAAQDLLEHFEVDKVYEDEVEVGRHFYMLTGEDEEVYIISLGKKEIEVRTLRWNSDRYETSNTFTEPLEDDFKGFDPANSPQFFQGKIYCYTVHDDWKSKAKILKMVIDPHAGKATFDIYKLEDANNQVNWLGIHASADTMYAFGKTTEDLLVFRLQSGEVTKFTYNIGAFYLQQTHSLESVVTSNKHWEHLESKGTWQSMQESDANVQLLVQDEKLVLYWNARGMLTRWRIDKETMELHQPKSLAIPEKEFRFTFLEDNVFTLAMDKQQLSLYQFDINTLKQTKKASVPAKMLSSYYSQRLKHAPSTNRLVKKQVKKFKLLPNSFRISKYHDTYVLHLFRETWVNNATPMMMGPIGGGAPMGFGTFGTSMVVKNRKAFNMAVDTDLQSFKLGGVAVERYLPISDVPYFVTEKPIKNQFGVYHAGAYWYGRSSEGKFQIFRVQRKE